MSQEEIKTTGEEATLFGEEKTPFEETTPIASESPEVPAEEHQEKQGDQLEEAERRAMEWEKQAAEFKEQWLRTVADFKNYKRRSEAEREELRKHAHADLLLKMLPVVDDLERAVANVPQEIVSSSWWEGMMMVTQKLRMLLESVGVKPIEAEGEVFDPNKHHAVLYEEMEGRDNEVIAVLQTGYFLHEQVLRPAMVKVGKNP